MAPSKTEFAPMSETTSLGRRSLARVGSRPEATDQAGERRRHPACRRRDAPGPDRAARSAEHEQRPRHAPKTAPGPHTPSSTPVRAGPPNMLKLSIQPAATLAAVSSSGRPGQRRQERPLRRPGHRQAVATSAARARWREGVLPARRATAVAPTTDRLDHVPREQYSLAPVPVAEQRGERGEDCQPVRAVSPRSPRQRRPRRVS